MQQKKCLFVYNSYHSEFWEVLGHASIERRTAETENISRRSFSSAALKALILELEQYRRQGVSLCLNGIPSSPQYIANACLLADGGGYMRDYRTDPEGKIRRVDFNYVSLSEESGITNSGITEKRYRSSGNDRYRKPRRNRI